MPPGSGGVRRYCWTVPDPDTVAFVAEHAQGGLVDPIAATGLGLPARAAGRRCRLLRPEPDAALVTNGWHGEDVYVLVGPKDCAEAAALHPDRTLFLAWPPYAQDVGARIVKACPGNRVIYIGEEQGHTGDDEMHLLLERDWTEVDSRQPVQFWGVHDRLTAYERVA